MELKEYWRTFVGEMTPREFVASRPRQDVLELAQTYVDSLPRCFGIVLRDTWRETFAATHQIRRADVVAGIVGYLEATRDEWLDLGESAFAEQPAEEATETTAGPLDSAAAGEAAAADAEAVNPASESAVPPTASEEPKETEPQASTGPAAAETSPPKTPPATGPGIRQPEADQPRRIPIASNVPEEFRPADD